MFGKPICGQLSKKMCVCQQRRVVHFASGETMEEDEEDPTHDETLREPSERVNDSRPTLNLLHRLTLLSET